MPPFSMHLHELTHKLSSHTETPNLDAQVLLAHIQQKPTAWVLAHPDEHLDTTKTKALKEALTKLQNGIPLPYVLGYKEFYNLDFSVSPDVLIPRPETEELVEYALGWIRHKENARILDMGTGSGCIPITIARNAPNVSLVAVDRSSAALNIARQNATKHEAADQIEFIESDLFNDLEHTTFDLITANLPYIPTKTLKTLDVFTREPTLALDGGDNGLSIISRFLRDAPKFINPNGLLLLEIDVSHGKEALETAQRSFPATNIDLVQDLTGRDRFIHIHI